MPKLSSLLPTIKHLYRNYKACKHMPYIPEIKITDDLILSSATKKEINKLKEFKTAADGHYGIPWYLTSLIFRRKLCFVIRKANGKTIAYRTFYFNEDDIRRGTVHGSFRYVVKEERRKGYGNLLVETTEQYFENHTSIKGFTSKVLESNIASAKSILKQGYRIISWENNAEGERINYYLKNL